MDERMILDKLEKWLEKPGNTPAKLAGLLSYASSNTVYSWLKNRHIPSHSILRLKEVLSNDRTTIKGNDGKD